MSSGALPTAEQQAALEYARSAMAYRNAYEYAEQGMDPRRAAVHGNEVAEYSVNLTMMAFLAGWVAIFSMAIGGNIPFVFGSLVVLTLIWRALRARLAQFAASDPGTTLVYPISTTALVLIGGVVVAVMCVGSFAVAVMLMPGVGG